MPITPTYPGVYIEELPAPGQAITGVGTSITAFVGYTKKGTTNQATQLFNFGDYERAFGSLDPISPVSYAVRQYFQNGGTEAWVVRVADGSAAGTIELLTSPGGATSVRVTARAEGGWSDNLRIDVDYDADNPADQFNLAVEQIAPPDGGDTPPPPAPEQFANLTMNSRSPNYAVDVVSANSRLVRLARGASGPLNALLSASDATSTSGAIGANVSGLDDDHRRLKIVVDGEGPFEFSLFPAGSAPASPTVAQVATLIATAVAALPDLSRAAKDDFSAAAAAVNSTTNNAIRAISSTNRDYSEVRFLDADVANAAGVLKLGLTHGGREQSSASAIRPAPVGTLSARVAIDFSALSASAAAVVTVHRPGQPPTPHTTSLWTAKPTDVEDLRNKLQTAVRAVAEPELAAATVDLVDGRLWVRMGEAPTTGTDPATWLEFANVAADPAANPPVAADSSATTVGLAGAGASANVHRYSFASSDARALNFVAAGSDGSPPTSPAVFTGSEANKTGMYALLDVDLFTIMCIPDVTIPAVLTEAVSFCERRRAFLIIDPPANLDSMPAARTWATGSSGPPKHKNAGAFFPRILAADPKQGYRVRAMAPSGAIAGVFARTDATRGVWKAPAGSDAGVLGAEGVTVKLTDPENGQLNPIGVNCLRVFPAYGTVVWGSRTVANTDPWRYIPVRRTALFIEESLYRGTQWCVFEPNDEELWAQIRMNVSAFMHNLFRQGAFQGSEPRSAYQVKCDSETTTQYDIDRGVVNIFVGFAPLKPAEFVIVQIAQLAGQVQS